MDENRDRRLYDNAGRWPMTVEERQAAFAEWLADNPDADELQRWGAEDLIRRQDAKAHRRAEAEAAGTTVWMLDSVDAEVRARRVAERDAAHLEAARRLRGIPEPVVAGRGKSASGQDWDPPGIPGFESVYRRCVAELVANHVPLRWESVAAWIDERIEPGRRRRAGGEGDAPLHWKTVAGWVYRKGLPHPRDLARDLEKGAKLAP